MVAGVPGVAIVIFDLLCFLRRRRRRDRQQPSQESTPSSQVRPGLSEVILPTETDAGPAVPELRTGGKEEGLVKMYTSHEMSNTSENHELPLSLEKRRMPSLLESHEVPVTQEIAELLDLT